MGTDSCYAEIRGELRTRLISVVFLDTIGGSANLAVNEGLTGDVAHIANIVLFIPGLLFFLCAYRSIFDGHPPSRIRPCITKRDAEAKRFG